MPNIEISAEQAAALARGENVTIAPPKPPKPKPKVEWNSTLICRDTSKQRCHATGLMYATDDPRGAAQAWVTGSRSVQSAIRQAGGGIVAVCRRSDAAGCIYTLATTYTRYFRVDAQCVVQETI